VAVGVAVDILQMDMGQFPGGGGDMIHHMRRVIATVADVGMPRVERHLQLGVPDPARQIDAGEGVGVVAVFQHDGAAGVGRARQNRGEAGGVVDQPGM
jgi:hypothetical protein